MVWVPMSTLPGLSERVQVLPVHVPPAATHAMQAAVGPPDELDVLAVVPPASKGERLPPVPLPVDAAPPVAALDPVPSPPAPVPLRVLVALQAMSEMVTAASSARRSTAKRRSANESGMMT